MANEMSEQQVQRLLQPDPVTGDLRESRQDVDRHADTGSLPIGHQLGLERLEEIADPDAIATEVEGAPIELRDLAQAYQLRTGRLGGGARDGQHLLLVLVERPEWFSSRM